MKQTVIHITSPTLRCWNWFNLECGVMVPGSEVFDENKALVQMDVDITSALDENTTPEAFIESVKENPHFFRGEQTFTVITS